MNRYPRIVVGYHGCEVTFASKLLAGEVPLSEWLPSNNSYDWLGSGIYFWEHAEARAVRWAKEKQRREGPGWRPAVVGALIQLGVCLDFTDEKNTVLLADAWSDLSATLSAVGTALPGNQG